MEKLLKICKSLIIIFVILLFVWIGLEFFVFDKKMELIYTFNDDFSRISSLYPWNRLSPINSNTQTLKDQLVYFSAEIPPNFSKAGVFVKYSGTVSDIKIGAEKAPGKFDFVNTINHPEGNSMVAKADFELRDIILSNYYIKNNTLNFAIQAPGVSESNKIFLSEIKIDLLKEKITSKKWNDMLSRIKNKYK